MALSEKDKQIGNAFRHAKARALEAKVPFDITLEYLRSKSIAVDICPIFGTLFEWGVSGLGTGNIKKNGPQLDRIIPELGYVLGNVAFISHRANRIKDNGTMEEHYAIADWIWEQEHAKQNTSASLSDSDYKDFDHDPELRALFTAGLGEDCDNFDDYCRTIFGQDLNYSAKARSRDSMGAGDFEVEPSEASAYIQGIRYSAAKISRHINRLGYLHRKFRERCLVDGKLPKVPELSDRREQSLQRSLDKAIQSNQEALKKLQETNNTDGYTNPSRTGRSLVAGGHT